MIGKKPASRPAKGGTYVRDARSGTVQPRDQAAPPRPAEPKKGNK